MPIMDEVEENLFAASDAKLHGEMCKALSAIYCKILLIFPSLEAARPRSKSGIQALCSLHIALERAKSILQHCSECSKLYLAITGDSVLSKFEKARSALVDSLRRVEDIVPQSIGCQVLEIVSELEDLLFSLDPLEKQVGDELIVLLQQGRKFENCSDSNELESFHRAATKVGITSSRAALTERRALKKLVDRARVDEDKRKESIVAYLLHLMRKYSKLFRSDLTDDNDSQGSAPCSPTVQCSFDEGHAFERHLAKISSFNFKSSNKRSGQIPVPPEELRCPISLQLMYDPVIIASGQTYERLCIEKWFNDGHETCPKTQQKLAHLSLTPNYCVKGLVTSWCEQNGVPVPDSPPESLDLNYFRLSLCQSESAKSRSVDSISCNKLKGIKVVPLEESGTIEEAQHYEMENSTLQQEETQLGDNFEYDIFQNYQNLLTMLNEEEDLRKKCGIVEKIRLLLKDDEEARIFLGANGFVEALLQFLESAVRARDAMAQEMGAMALFNLAVNNNRNKQMMLAAGVISLLEMMISNSDSYGPATALYLNLSCLEEAKSVIGTSLAVPFLVQILTGKAEPQCKMDALHALYNLSSKSSNISGLLSAGVTNGLQSLLAAPGHLAWTERSIAVLINLAANQSAKDEMATTPGLIGGLSTVLDTGEPIEQEQAASCLYILCNGSDNCSQLVLQEGVIPALVSMSVNGTTRGKEKAQKLLMLFREQRQRDQPPKSPPQAVAVEPRLQRAESSSLPTNNQESNPLCKSVSRRKMGKAFSLFWKSKSYSVYQC
ncbi:U-box domain-containing protein 6-like [Euphorbia lathyris]|uniref:U-box domain-containing protein 6-like n=1 Tax=Euphorbia lathyris TaxID=212925 RepID=UPI003313F70A